MSDGLKTASGPMLAKILEKGTNTRLKGLLTGFLATAILQSSSATTLITIGFVNAGVLSFVNSLWVIFGTNIGTTMTGWIVALIGLKVKIELFSLPLIGFGVLMRVLGEKKKWGNIGDILAGFGILFLGIGFLQQGFSNVGEIFDFAAMSGNGYYSLLYFLLGGIVLTIIMQSSSASIAVILTIASTTTLPLQEAAASVIGANIGTTLTAVLAALHATPNAKRAASGHVIFNFITGIVALILLPVIVGLLDYIRPLFGLDDSTSTSLALFHTVFNVLGVILMIPLTSHLARILMMHFTRGEESTETTQYLDNNLMNMPPLAIDSLDRELARYGHLTLDVLRDNIEHLMGKETIPKDEKSLEKLNAHIVNFINTLHEQSMSKTTAEKIANSIKAYNYYDLSRTNMAEIGAESEHYKKLPVKIQKKFADFLEETLILIDQLNPEAPSSHAVTHIQEEEYIALYKKLKSYILKAESEDEITVYTMDSMMKSIHIIKGIILRSIPAAKVLMSHKRK
ncbi:Na/Pi cotransporter family protein [Candidatus Gracilibacteria bacterium]|nr:Na/Pi cotransporter family protein [Candidatus Gracilibacteria bacterium]